MEELLEKQTEVEEDSQKKDKKHLKILGITLWRLHAYFVIYSIIGFLIETIFGIIRYGVLESRRSFLYGPFCAIYGVGAVIMILSLQYFKKNYTSLFIGGCIVGSITEYLVSWIGEILLHVKWWDYSEFPLNINGRICLLYAVFWGFLGLYLMISLNPKIDKLINFIKNKVPANILQIFVTLTIIFMFVDCVTTGIALNYFNIRVIKENAIEVSHQKYIDAEYEKIYNNEFKVKIINRFLDNKKMLETFPRLTIQDKSGKIIYIKDLYPQVKTYYFKIN